MKQTGEPTNWKEGRRIRAWELRQLGWKQKDIARALGVTEGAVSQWMKTARSQGKEGLRHQPPPGVPARLSSEQRAQIPLLLDRGAEAYGFCGNVWNTARVAKVIEQEFGVRYHPTHCGRLLRQLHYSYQKPVERASQRNEEAIATWKQERWPALKKAIEEQRTIIFVDESAFYLLPMVVRTYAPCGETPILKVPLTRDHLSAIGGLTPQGRLFMQVQDHSYKSPEVIGFLQMLLRKIPGKLLIIWDGAPIHRSNVVKDFLSQ